MISLWKRNRRGSLELSANAIVILVIAITILGLGLGFVKGMFGKLMEKIGVQAESIDFSEPPTADTPLTIVAEMELPRGGQKKLTIGFYNNKNCGFDTNPSTTTIDPPSVVPMFASCVGETGTWTTTMLPTIIAAPLAIACGEITEFTSIVKGPGTMMAGSSVCTVKVDVPQCGTTGQPACLGQATSKQITLTVPG